MEPTRYSQLVGRLWRPKMGNANESFPKAKVYDIDSQVHCSEGLRMFTWHDLPCLNPCYLVLIIYFESAYLVQATVIIRSFTFEHVLASLTGRKFSDLHAAPLCKLAIRWLSANLLETVQNPVKSARKRVADLFRQFL